jgi:L-rhamnose mutarotase
MIKLSLVSIRESPLKDKKYKALFSNGKVIHFGQRGAEDYTIHKDDERKRLYLLRHKKRENWNNPLTSGALSRWVLWNKPTLRDSIADYKKKFDL